MSNNPGLGLALASMALSNAIEAQEANDRADEAEEAYEEVVTTEAETMGRVISKRESFREAAIEMAAEISRNLSKGLTDDVEDIRVRKGLFSIFKSSVPADILSDAKQDAQFKVNSVIKHSLSVHNFDLASAATNALILGDLEDANYTPGTGSAFIDGLDDKEVAAIAKLGVINSVQFELDEATLPERKKEETRQQHRALGVAFGHAIEAAGKICDEMKAPFEKIVIANDKNPYAPSAP